MNEWLYPDFSAMQERLSLGYSAYASATTTEERRVWIAPVGPAFQVIHDDVISSGIDPTLPGNDFYELFTGDGSHPSPLGTQLAAYVFYASVTGASPVGLAVPEGMDLSQIRRLQNAANAVVFDDSDAFCFPWESGSEEFEDTGTGENTATPDPDSGDGGDAADSGGAGTGGEADEEELMKELEGMMQDENPPKPNTNDQREEARLAEIELLERKIESAEVKSKLPLPSSVLPSKKEEKLGLLQAAA